MRINEVFQRLQTFDEEVEKLRKELGGEVYDAKHKLLVKSLRQTFTTEILQQERALIKTVISKKHNPSKKELVSGVDKTPHMEGMVQPGKIFTKGRNLEMLRQELLGRRRARLGQEFTETEKQRIVTLGLRKLKDEIKEDEILRFPTEDYTEKFFAPIFSIVTDYTFSHV